MLSNLWASTCLLYTSNRARVSFLRLLYNKLIDNEVNEKYANEIIDEIDKNCKQDVNMDYMPVSYTHLSVPELM